MQVAYEYGLLRPADKVQRLDRLRRIPGAVGPPMEAMLAYLVYSTRVSHYLAPHCSPISLINGPKLRVGEASIKLHRQVIVIHVSL